jgi:transposase
MSPAPAAPDTLATLPDDPVVLKRMLAELLEALHRRDHELQQVQARLDQVLRRLYGPRAERYDPNQPWLFDAPATATAASAAAAGPEADTPARRSGHGRQRLPKHLVREQRVYELTEVERRCPCCGDVRAVLGQETCEQLDFVPASLRIVEHVKLTYACPRCERQRRPASAAASPAVLTPTETIAVVNAALGSSADGVGVSSTFVTAPRPAQGVPRCLAAPGLLAHVIVSKFADHLPLYRLERMFARQGVPLARQTLCDWLARSAELLTPLCQMMIQQVLHSRVIQTDDTPVPVQDSTRDHTRQGRVWVYHGDVAHPYLVYRYSPNRERQWPQTFLKDYTGFVQADAYAGYDKLFVTGRIIEVGCWAHARRKFFESQTTDPERALYVLGVIRQLYAVEKRARQEQAELNLPRTEYWMLRQRLRQEQSVPVLATLCHWLREQHAQVLPKSPIGEAITYALNQWAALTRYTTQGFLEIDNNAAERALRAVAVGRKNYLFFGSDVGGATAAVLYSLVQTCKHLGIEPWRYLRDVLERMPTHPTEQLEELLPDRWAQAQRATADTSMPALPPDSG